MAPAEKVHAINTAVELLVGRIVKRVEHLVGRSDDVEKRAAADGDLLLPFTCPQKHYPDIVGGEALALVQREGNRLRWKRTNGSTFFTY